MTLGGVSTTDTVIGADVSVDKAFAGGGLYFSLLARKSGHDELSAQDVLGVRRQAEPGIGSSGRWGLHGAEVDPGAESHRGRERCHPHSFLGARNEPDDLGGEGVEGRDAEPAAWQLTATDGTASLQSPGAVGITTYLSSAATNSPVTASIDNFSTSTSTGNQPPTAVFAATVNGCDGGGGFGGFGRSGRDDRGVLVGLG